LSYHPLRVREVVRETHDTLSYVLDVPAELQERFRYRAGQFLTFKVPAPEGELLRCYSLSSAPETDAAPKVTVKLVPGGRGSGWFHGTVKPGSTLQVMQPAGRFVLHDAAERPLLLFAGGSGVTPILSLIKAALTTTQRRIRIFYANRDAASVIFRAELDALAAKHGARLELIHHLDAELGLTSRPEVERMHAGFEQADAYLCGPGPFMELVEQTLLARGHSRDHLWIERFEGVGEHSHAGAAAAPGAGAGAVPKEVVVHLDQTVHRIPYAKGQSLLAAARKAGLGAPFACEEGYCGSCAAKKLRGSVTMLANDVFTPEEVAQGWILTCQGHAEGDECEISWDV
jgi:3-ketosteroid 9alpha-monooxygenase subunit B